MHGWPIGIRETARAAAHRGPGGGQTSKRLRARKAGCVGARTKPELRAPLGLVCVRCGLVRRSEVIRAIWLEDNPYFLHGVKGAMTLQYGRISCAILP